MYDYEEYYEDDYGYDEDVINESALDMAMDMSDRYGVAIEDAYDFAEYAMEGSLKDPRKRTLREIGRTEAARRAHNASASRLEDLADEREKARRRMYDSKDGRKRAAYAELKTNLAEDAHRDIAEQRRHADARFERLDRDTKTYPYRNPNGRIVHPNKDYSGYQRAISKYGRGVGGRGQTMTMDEFERMCK